LSCSKCLGTKLEGLFADELARLQPSSGYMRLVKERVVQVWDRAKSDVKEKAEAVERRIKAIRLTRGPVHSD